MTDEFDSPPNVPPLLIMTLRQSSAHKTQQYWVIRLPLGPAPSGGEKGRLVWCVVRTVSRNRLFSLSLRSSSRAQHFNVLVPCLNGVIVPCLNGVIRSWLPWRS